MLIRRRPTGWRRLSAWLTTMTRCCRPSVPYIYECHACRAESGQPCPCAAQHPRFASQTCSSSLQVTGTAKQHVADDYNMRIAAGREEADAVVRRGLEAMLLPRCCFALASSGGACGGCMQHVMHCVHAPQRHFCSRSKSELRCLNDVVHDGQHQQSVPTAWQSALTAHSMLRLS